MKVKSKTYQPQAARIGIEGRGKNINEKLNVLITYNVSQKNLFGQDI
jgi:hypothetical protein